MLRDFIAWWFGFDEEARERQARANLRYAATLAQSSGHANPAQRWGGHYGPTDITVRRFEAERSDGTNVDMRALERAMDVAGLDAAEREKVRRALR
jgi:hypothetical protein